MADLAHWTALAHDQAAALGAPAAVRAVAWVETLYYYDGPRMLLAEVDGVLHYGHQVVEGQGWDLFLYAPVSAVDVARIRANGVALRDVLTGADRVLVVKEEWGTSIAFARTLPGRDLPDDWLPEAGVGLAPGPIV